MLQSISYCCRFSVRARVLALSLAMLLNSTAAFAQDDPAPEAVTVNPVGMLLQRDHPDSFVGGEEVIVSVTITAASDTTLYALGLYETPPAGWTFEGLYVDGGPSPDILPPMGASGVLEFGWVSPAVPVQLRYALRIPVQDEGGKFFSGQVEYRLETDPRQHSAPVLTQIEGVANERPVVTLLGAARISSTEGQAFIDPGATAQDKEDGDLSEQVSVFGQVDTSQPGENILTYGVVDSTGNRAIPVTRVVEVIAANTDGNGGSGGGGSPNAPRPGPVQGGSAGPSTGMASKTPTKTSASMDLVLPELALGESKPEHQLPRGHGEEPGPTTADSVEAPDLTHGMGGGAATSGSGDTLGAEGGEGEKGTARAQASGGGDFATDGGSSPLVLAAIALVCGGCIAGWRIAFTGPRRRSR